ncbi:hypothetical protein [Desulfurispora sp.]|uniref:hypothetical protein n=1 Tax=Desulfurispora sp. TaxID=3014275 RepID=UPI0040494A9B
MYYSTIICMYSTFYRIFLPTPACPDAVRKSKTGAAARQRAGRPQKPAGWLSRRHFF